MPLSEEEVKQITDGITSGKPLTEIELLKPLSEKGLYISTPSQIESEKTSAIQKAIDDRTAEWSTKLEADILELTGLPKEANEKYHQYLKRTVPLVKGDPTKVSNLEAQLAELKKSGNIDPILKKELEELRESIPKMNETHTQEIARLKKENEVILKTNEISKGFSNFKFKDTLPASTISRERNWAVNTMLEMESEVREQDGVKTLVFLDKNGHALRNTDNTIKTAEQIATELLVDVLAEDRRGAGAGSGGSGGSGGAGGGVDFGVNFEIPDTIGSMEELDDLLKKNAVSSTSEVYDKIMKHYKTEVKLPLMRRNNR